MGNAITVLNVNESILMFFSSQFEPQYGLEKIDVAHIAGPLALQESEPKNGRASQIMNSDRIADGWIASGVVVERQRTTPTQTEKLVMAQENRTGRRTTFCSSQH